MTVFFSGRVQGVGFRYTAEALAERFRVTGFVRNLPDGRVELVAEGPEPELLSFLRAIESSRLGRYIQGKEVIWGPSTGEFSHFTIRYDTG